MQPEPAPVGRWILDGPIPATEASQIGALVIAGCCFVAALVVVVVIYRRARRQIEIDNADEVLRDEDW